MIKIKDFAAQTSFSIRMLRYLEDIDLLIPQRDTNNYRIYSESQISIAKGIKKLQNLGIQLKEIEELKSDDPAVHLRIITKALKREQDIAEIKSETIPELKSILDGIKQNNMTIYQYLDETKEQKKFRKKLGGDSKFHRTAYTIPILRNIYEDHLTIDANVELIRTDLMKFQEWLEELDYIPCVYSVLNESTFVIGSHITQSFIDGYEKAWKKYLPKMGFQKLDDFLKEDVEQLFGPHDIVIRSTFKYKDTGVEAQVVIPYTPIYTMSELSNQN